jgi:hypothetical protein
MRVLGSMDTARTAKPAEISAWPKVASGSGEQISEGCLHVTHLFLTLCANHGAFRGFRVTANVFPVVMFKTGVSDLKFCRTGREADLRMQDKLAERRRSREYGCLRPADKAKRLLNRPLA